MTTQSNYIRSQYKFQRTQISVLIWTRGRIHVIHARWPSVNATRNCNHSSPHNAQPWRVRLVSDTEADLFIDSARTLPKEDPTGSFIILTMGMFIESLRLIAAHHGYKLEHTEYHEPSWYALEILKLRQQTFLPFARLQLTPDPGQSSDVDPALFLKRRTSRISLKPDPVPATITESLRAKAQTWDKRYETITDQKSQSNAF